MRIRKRNTARQLKKLIRANCRKRKVSYGTESFNAQIALTRLDYHVGTRVNHSLPIGKGEPKKAVTPPVFEMNNKLFVGYTHHEVREEEFYMDTLRWRLVDPERQ
ncbi:hypothetical protein M427DRAFT_144284, partial [Gonapodya prolifera JEL478]